jgi:hypothetical protein
LVVVGTSALAAGELIATWGAWVSVGGGGGATPESGFGVGVPESGVGAGPSALRQM